MGNGYGCIWNRGGDWRVLLGARICIPKDSNISVKQGLYRGGFGMSCESCGYNGRVRFHKKLGSSLCDDCAEDEYDETDLEETLDRMLDDVFGENCG